MRLPQDPFFHCVLIGPELEESQLDSRGVDIANTMSESGLSYKKEHELFVSNHSGTTAEEIALICTTVPLSLLIFGLLSVLIRADAVDGAKSFRTFKRVVLEFGLIIMPAILASTIFSEFIILVVAALIVLALLSFLTLLNQLKPEMVEPEELIIAKPKYMPFVTNYRAAMLLSTALGILSVDFPAFPRRFAKTETFGFGLMDAGVGTFVFIAGFVSQEARKGADRSRSTLQVLQKSCNETVPLLLLGFIRLASVKATDYHEHVTEYGVHWNFFFTLALIKVFCALFFAVVSVDWSWLASLAVALLHEFSLQALGLEKWMLDSNASRDNLIAANREGFFSTPGFVAVFLAGIAWGSHVTRLKPSLDANWKEVKTMSLWSLVMWLSLLYSQHELFNPPSRRLANWNYFQWMVALNLTFLTAFLIIDLVVVTCAERSRHTSSRNESKSVKNFVVDANNMHIDVLHVAHRVPLIFHGIAYNGLIYFLLANLLTGLVNFTVATIHTEDIEAVLIISGYALLLCIIFAFLFVKRIRLKAW